MADQHPAPRAHRHTRQHRSMGAWASGRKHESGACSAIAAVDRSSVGSIPMTYQLGTASSMSGQAKRNMNVDDIIANDAQRDALWLSATAFRRWGIAYPADLVGDPAAVAELGV